MCLMCSFVDHIFFGARPNFILSLILIGITHIALAENKLHGEMESGREGMLN